MLSKIYSLAELRQAAEFVLHCAEHHTVIAFYGAMGAGKTTLIREICAQCGVGDNVSSPTFSLINEYHCNNGNPVYHFDFYRIKNIDEALQIGVEEYFNGTGLCLLEWAELVEPLLPNYNTLHIQITVVSEIERQLTIINECHQIL